MTPTPAPQRPVLAIRRDAWFALRAGQNLESDQALADTLGLSMTSVYRVMNGKAEPGHVFIAQTLHAFPTSRFEQLFTVKAPR